MRPERFSVRFSGREGTRIYYGKDVGRAPSERYSRNESAEENLQLGYAISVHKAQGSEFSRVYFILPKVHPTRQLMELIYTGLTRARQHLTVFAQESVAVFLEQMRKERSALTTINSSLFEFRPVKDELIDRAGWYEAGKVHKALTKDMVRSKSEVIIANMLHERGIGFEYEKPLIASDGTMYLPDFTLKMFGDEYFWEHVGRLDLPEYAAHWHEKKAWYDKHFPGRLRTTFESRDLSEQASQICDEFA